MLKLRSYEEGCKNVPFKTVQKLGSGSMDTSDTRHVGDVAEVAYFARALANF